MGRHHFILIARFIVEALMMPNRVYFGQARCSDRTTLSSFGSDIPTLAKLIPLATILISIQPCVSSSFAVSSDGVLGSSSI